MNRTCQRVGTRTFPAAFTRLRCRHAVVAIVLTAAACGPADSPAALDGDDDARPDILFITQVQEPTAHMGALFDGPVVADPSGCLRLSSPDPSTVIWPHGFTLRGSEVRNERGGRVGRIGESFRLGGGEVPMHDGLGFSAADMQTIQARCPGTFWYTGEIR